MEKENTDLRAIPQTPSEPKYGPNTICAYASCGHPRRMHFAGGCSKNFCQCAGFWERAESAAPEPNAELGITPGRWFVRNDPTGSGNCIVQAERQQGQSYGQEILAGEDYPTKLADAEFIVSKWASVASKPREDSVHGIGALWVIYHGAKISQWENVNGEEHRCPYCNHVKEFGHHRDCMIGNGLRMLDESIEEGIKSEPESREDSSPRQPLLEKLSIAILATEHIFDVRRNDEKDQARYAVKLLKEFRAEFRDSPSRPSPEQK